MRIYMNKMRRMFERKEQKTSEDEDEERARDIFK